MTAQASAKTIDVTSPERIAKLEAHLEAKIRRLLVLLKGLTPASPSNAP